MELKDLTVFMAVADVSGFRRAAAKLGVRQSMISKRVRALEDELGVSLFERHRAGVRLTHAGRDFLDRTRHVLADIDHATRTARSAGVAAEGRLAIGLITSISQGFQRELIARSRQTSPEVRVELREGERSDLLSRLKDRRLDLALVTGEVDPVHGDSTAMWSEPVYVALSAQHPRASAAHLGWEDLRGERFIVGQSEPGPEIHEQIVRRLADLGKHPDVERHAVGRETLINMVGLGFGITMAGESWSGVDYPGVVLRPIRDGSPGLTFTAVWQHDNDNPALRRFLSEARLLSKRYAAQRETPDPSP